jgi:hypothetical protein
MLLRDSKAPKKRMVAARVESYHKGYLVGLQCGARKVVKKVKQVRKPSVTKASKKMAIAKKIEAYQKGYQLGTQSGAVRERAELKKAQQEEAKAKKVKRWKCSYARSQAHREELAAKEAARNKRSKAWMKRLAEAKVEAYKDGMRKGARRTRSKLSKLRGAAVGHGQPTGQDQEDYIAAPRYRIYGKLALSRQEAAQASRAPRYRIYGKLASSKQAAANSTSVFSTLLQYASSPMRADDPLSPSPTRSEQTSSRMVEASAPAAKRAPKTTWPLLTFPAALRDAPTPSRRRAKPVGGALAQVRRVAQEPASSVRASSIAAKAAPSGASSADNLRYLLEDPTGVTTKPAVFQLRCKHKCEVSEVTKNVVIVVGGKFTLWKLNQIIGECFNASDHDFEPKKGKGATVLGSHFQVSRPLEPGHCDKVIISSRCSASHVGKTDFVDDRNYTVAELFRGTSTRCALEREAGDAAQQVTFASPLLSADVSVGLDGIMLDSYDSGNVFDKNRRHGNGKMPLPRIVCSSFLDLGEIETKNNAMQCSQKGVDFLSKFDNSWSGIHASYRRSEYRQLFREGGGDFGLVDARRHHVGGHDDVDEAWDAD